MALAFYSETDDPRPWREAIRAALPDLDFRIAPDLGNPSDIDVTLVWKPPRGWHRQFPNLRAILSLGAGVDALLEDTQLPEGIPITRMVDAGMGRQMAEYAAYGVMHFHRRMDDYARAQREGRWTPLEPVSVRDFPVGILGLGVLGVQAAALLVAMGYPVRGWTRSRKSLAGVESFCGMEELNRFLAGTRALVNFLPLTPETRGFIDGALLARLPRGAYLVNLARGGHVVEDDVLSALEDGALAGAMLDVFAKEPLATDHPFWRHPRVVVTPHVAAVTQAEDAAAQVIENLRRLRDGEPLRGVVDRARGY